MVNSTAQNVDMLVGAWHEFQARMPIKMAFVHTDQHYRAMVDFMNELMDEIGDDEGHPIAGLLNLVASFVRDYEDRGVAGSDLGPHRTGQYHESRVASSAPTSAPRSRQSLNAVPLPYSNTLPGPRLALPREGGYPNPMKRLEIDLSDETFAGLDRESGELAADLRAAAAAKLYELGRVSQEVASQIAGVSRSEFLTVLAQLKVSPMQESAAEALAGADVLLQS